VAQLRIIAFDTVGLTLIRYRRVKPWRMNQLTISGKQITEVESRLRGVIDHAL
jgi:hypothetical protein